MRASVTYFVEDGQGVRSQEKIDCKFLFPSICFLQYATIGSSSFEFMIGSGELLRYAFRLSPYIQKNVIACLFVVDEKA